MLTNKGADEAMRACHDMISAPNRKHFLTLGYEHPRVLLPLLASPWRLSMPGIVRRLATSASHKAHVATLLLKNLAMV